MIRLALAWNLWRSLDPEDQALIRQMPVRPLKLCMAARRYGFNTDAKIHALLTHEDESFEEMLGRIVGLAKHRGL